MCETITAIVGFLFWMLHSLIFYKINQSYPDHTPEIEPGPVNINPQSPEKVASPRPNEKTSIVSQPSERQSASLDAADCPPSRNNPRNMKIHHSVATENGIEDYVEILEDEQRQAMRQEMFLLQQKIEQLSFNLRSHGEMKYENHRLKQEVASMRTAASGQEKQCKIIETQLRNKAKLMEDKEILETKLNSLYTENRKIMDAEEAAKKSAQEEKALAEKHLSTIACLKSDLEFADHIIHEKILANDQLHDELANLKKLTAVVDRQNIGMKMDMKRLNESVRKRKSDWRSSELKLIESNEDLKKKLGQLQTDNQSLLESNSLVKTELDSANKEIENLREKIAVKEQGTTLSISDFYFFTAFGYHLVAK